MTYKWQMNYWLDSEPLHITVFVEQRGENWRYRVHPWSIREADIIATVDYASFAGAQIAAETWLEARLAERAATDEEGRKAEHG
jgi:hypothetical protein